MLRWALIFLALSVVTGILGFGGISGGAAAVSKVLFLFALAGLVIFGIAAVVVERRTSR